MSGDVVVTEADAGRTLRVPSGGVVELRLGENPTTGMRWALPGAGEIEVIDDGYAPGPDAGIGAAATRVLQFRLKSAPGKGLHLRLERRQEWEPGMAPDAVFELDLQAE